MRRASFVASLAFVACASTQTTPQNAVTSVNAWEAHLGIDATDARALDDLPDRGMRLVDVSGWSLNGAPHFSSVWVFADVHGWETRWALDEKSLALEDESHARAGMRLSRLDAYDVAGSPRFAAIWELGAPDDRTWRTGLDAKTFAEEIESHAQRGEMLVDLSTSLADDALTYSAIWQRSDPTSALATTPHLALGLDDLSALLGDLATKNERPISIDVAVLDHVPRFAVLTSNAPGGLWVARCNLDRDEWQREMEDALTVGYRPTRITGYVLDDGKPRFCGIWSQ